MPGTRNKTPQLILRFWLVMLLCFSGSHFPLSCNFVCAAPAGHDDDDEDEIRFQTVSRLTLSFAEDGTPISRFESQLFTAFSNILTREEIESLVLEAFQKWAQHSAINVGLVEEFDDEGNPIQMGDPGLPFGTGGASQGDVRFGDIRIGAVPMAPDVFAVAVPNSDFVSGTWSGDLLFNSDAEFVDANQLFAVALHEAGHVLGLGHSPNETSVMHPTALNTEFNEMDLLELKSLYGERIYLDENDDPDDEDNDEFERAEEFENEEDINGEVPLMVFGDIENENDVDFFEFEPLQSGVVNFRVVSKNVSLLQPRLTIFRLNDDTDQLIFLEEETSVEQRGSDISVDINVEDEEVYYVKVEAAGNELTNFGTYGLIATILENVMQGEDLIEPALRRNFGDLDQEDLQELFLTDLMSPIVDDLHTNDTFMTASPLMPPVNIALHSSYREQASISNAEDIDFYSLIAEGEVMTVRVTALQDQGLIADIRAFDAQQNELAGITKVNGNGELLIEFPNVVPSDLYFLSVAADVPSGDFGTGNYDLNVAFAAEERILDSLLEGIVNRQRRHREHTLYVARTQLFHFLFSGTNNYYDANATIWMSIYDEHGDLRFRVATKPNESRSARSVILTPGSYSVAVDFTSRFGNFLTQRVRGRSPQVAYLIEGVGVSEPTGPEVIDPADDPFGPCDKAGSDFCYPNDRFSPDPFIFVDNDEVDVVPNDPPPTWVDSNDWYWVVDWLG